MLRLRHLLAPFALACAVVTAPATAQGPVTSITDQLQQQAIREVLQTQQVRVLRSLVLRRDSAAPQAEPAPLPPLRLGTLEDSIARYEVIHQQNRRWSQSLLTLGAAALVGGFASTMAGEAREISGLQRTLIWGGFGMTVLGADQWKAAGRAWAQAEKWRSVQHLAAQRPHR
ncbi:hypothetical protein BH23GEM7_BH23GEM7_41480 [soil metagenome]|nr:hypothetical protein [Gemmatimonadota bacterium]